MPVARLASARRRTGVTPNRLREIGDIAAQLRLPQGPHIGEACPLNSRGDAVAGLSIIGAEHIVLGGTSSPLMIVRSIALLLIGSSFIGKRIAPETAA